MLIQDKDENQSVVICDDTSVSVMEVGNGQVQLRNLDPYDVKTLYEDPISFKWYSPLIDLFEHLPH